MSALTRTPLPTRQYYPTLSYLFVMGSALSQGKVCSYMDYGAFISLMEEGRISDPKSKACKPADLDTTFKAANFGGCVNDRRENEVSTPLYSSLTVWPSDVLLR